MDLILSFLQQGFSYIGPFFILLGLLIFVHELGHFAVAKYFGVRVEVFSLGFGRKLAEIRRGDTNYRISLIPLGGYVKMFGDDPSSPVPESEKPYSFLDKPVGQRIAIVLAGPLMNLFFAAVLFTGIAFIGENVPGPVAGDIEAGSHAYKVGFRSGDEILSVNGKEVDTWKELDERIQTNPGQRLSFVVKHESGEQETVQATPTLADNANILSTRSQVGSIEGLKFEARSPVVALTSHDTVAGEFGFGKFELISAIDGQEVRYFRQVAPLLNSAAQDGRIELELTAFSPADEAAEPRKVTLENLPSEVTLASLGLDSPELYLYRVKEGSPAHEAGLQSGDKIVALNGTTTQGWKDIVNTVKSYSEDEGKIRFTLARDKETIEQEIAPHMTELMNQQGQDEQRYTVGIIPALSFTTPPPVEISTSNPVKAVVIGAEKTVEWTNLVVMSLVRLVQAEVSSRNIGGVITIGRVASQSFEVGISAFLKIMAIISINLFLLNLLPVPVLDGGHLLFFTIEALRGAPLSMRKMEIAQQVGLIILMTLMAFALFNDITNIFRSPW